MKLTKYQSKLLKFISSFTEKNDYSPSYREIRDKMGYTSTASVALHVDNLVEYGYLRKMPNKARSLEVVDVEDAWITKRACRAAVNATEAEKAVLIQALIMMGFFETAKQLGYNGTSEWNNL